MIEMDERRPWTGFGNLLLIGPGAAGKSSLGLQLAPLLNRRCVDLDKEFECQVGNISTFIQDEGYERYKLRNSELAEQLATESIVPTLLITSSGFLTPDNPDAALEVNRKLLKTWYSLCLLPSRDLEQAVTIIVHRQLQRAFSRDRIREEATIRERYPVYAGIGDLIVFSAASPEDTAQAIAKRFSAKI
ncbi:shikimate kinase [Hyphomicrobium sp.]|uniref:shikimate kinase n=1 Tax=Hyphomicrobium sp. TaxID=82 RepID=UPI0025B9219B|nr:shikimate kinase [Hyphomicrobium sp.]MCC7253660.1 shikimate kinase [Hyphomicrobium sp.]